MVCIISPYDLLLKFSQQSILGIFINLRFVFNVLGPVCISVTNKKIINIFKK